MAGGYTQGLQGSPDQDCVYGQSGPKAFADKAPGAQVSSEQAEGNSAKKRSRESDALSANLRRRQHRTPDVAVSRKEVRNLHPASYIDARHQAEDAAEYVNFLSSLPHLTSVVKENRRPLLPPQQPGADKKTLVLDLDHTLIRSTQHSPHKPKGVKEIFMTTDGACTAFQRRPFLKEFLEEVCQLFEVAIFTAGSRSYAEPLLDILDPERRFFSHRLYRDACLRVPSQARPGMAFLMKDLTSLGRPLEGLLIVDNTPTVFGYQVNNGVPIVSWYDDMADRELVNILPFIKSLAGVRDVRPLIAQHSSLHRMVDEAFSTFPAAFPCAMPAPPAEAEPMAPTTSNPGLDILADACMGLGCDEQLEPQMDKFPLKPLEPLGELPDLALAPSENATLAHLSGQRPGVSALAYPSAALAQRILGERSEAPALSDPPAQMQAHMRPHMRAPDGDDAAVAPVELLCAEADRALQQLQGNVSNDPSSSWTTSNDDSMPGGNRDNASTDSSMVLGVSAADEASMWVDEQIAEAELLQHLEDSDSPVEATAQLSLPMFPELASVDGQLAASTTQRSEGADAKPSKGSAFREAAGADVGLRLHSAASAPDLDEKDFVTPAGSPRKQAASAPPMLDMRFARSDSLASAASHPSCDSRKLSAACHSSGSRLGSALQGALPPALAEQGDPMQELNGLGNFALHCLLGSPEQEEQPTQPNMAPGLRSPQLLCA